METENTRPACRALFIDGYGAIWRCHHPWGHINHFTGEVVHEADIPWKPWVGEGVVRWSNLDFRETMKLLGMAGMAISDT